MKVNYPESKEEKKSVIRTQIQDTSAHWYGILTSNAKYLMRVYDLYHAWLKVHETCHKNEMKGKLSKQF